MEVLLAVQVLGGAGLGGFGGGRATGLPPGILGCGGGVGQGGQGLGERDRSGRGGGGSGLAATGFSVSGCS